jgi:hypothetical protein
MGKLLTILGVSDEIQNKMPRKVLNGERLVEVMQEVYSKSPESSKKEALANAISESVRLLLLEVNKYKNVVVQNEQPEEPEPPQPKVQEVKDVPFKIGDRFVQSDRQGKNDYVYTIEGIDIENNITTISGKRADGRYNIKDFNLDKVIGMIEDGMLIPYVEKKKRKPREKKPKELPPPPSIPTPEPEPPQRVTDPETIEKIREVQEQIDEINDTLEAFEQGTEDYNELLTELQALQNRILELNN